MAAGEGRGRQGSPDGQPPRVRQPGHRRGQVPAHSGPQLRPVHQAGQRAGQRDGPPPGHVLGGAGGPARRPRGQPAHLRGPRAGLYRGAPDRRLWG